MQGPYDISLWVENLRHMAENWLRWLKYHIKANQIFPHDSWGWKVPNLHISKMAATGKGDM